MKSFAVAAALAGAAMAAPQAVTSAISPSSSAPAGCSTSYSGSFELYVAKAGSKMKRDSTPLTISLSNGVLTDSKGRTGYIAANNQFQFDGPVQAGAIYTAGWSVCSNTSLALGGSTVFYECLSGTFYNLYDDNESAQCSPIELQALSMSGNAAQGGDGQVTAPSAGPKTVLCQITDGQVQQNTCTANVITQISDGQVQAPTGAPITQISDGQVQAPTGSPITQISDGQVQAPTGTPVSQISDGQVQAGTATPSPVMPSTNGTAPAKTSSPVATQTGNMANAQSFNLQLAGAAAGMLALLAL